MDHEQIEVPLYDDTIRLGQLLKLASVVENGAMAREVIDMGAVSVDGTVEMRRGRQIAVGQVVDVAGESFGLPNVTLRPTTP